MVFVVSVTLSCCFDGSVSCAFEFMHVFLMFCAFLFVGVSCESVLLFISVLCMCDIVCKIVSLTHHLGDTLGSDNVPW